MSPTLRKARREDLEALIKLMMTYCKLTTSQAMNRLSGPEPLQLEEMVQGLINKVKEGDVPAFKFFMETMLGKIPEDDEGAFTDEDLRILKRVKELREEERKENAASAK